jgi:hypothetical protein
MNEIPIQSYWTEDPTDAEISSRRQDTSYRATIWQQHTFSALVELTRLQARNPEHRFEPEVRPELSMAGPKGVIWRDTLAEPTRLSLNSRQSPKSAQTWLPKNSSPPWTSFQNRTTVELVTTSESSLPRRPCLALHPCALPVHPPPTTAKASALAGLMSGASLSVISK